jgi:hypothetical protein
MNARRWLATSVAAIALAACASPAAPGPTVPASAVASVAPGGSPTAPPTTIPAPTVARLAGSFDIGGGRELYLECLGSGSPTILLEAGDEDSGAGAWQSVLPKVLNSTRTCLYDRAGVGRSSPAEGCRQLGDILDDLDALLAAASIKGPFILVGASGGGFLIAGFAARHPEQVSGMVFVETPKALTAKLYPEILPEIACDAPNNIERRDYLKVEHAAWDHRTKLGNFPLVVMSNDYGDTVPANTDEATNVEDQRGWYDLTSGKTSQVVVTSGHNIAFDDPERVADQILGVLGATR